MLEYARWKYMLVAAVLAVALLFALPNLFGDDYALQIARKDRSAIDSAQLATIETTLKDAGVSFSSVELDGDNVTVRFPDNEAQLKGRDIVKDEKTGLTKEYVNAMMYASRAPRWIQVLGLRAMPLGLDLRGGLYLLYQVDVDGAVESLLNTYDQDFRRALTEREDHLHRHQHAHGRFGHSRTACACCCPRARTAPRCARLSRRRNPISPAVMPSSPTAPRSIA